MNSPGQGSDNKARVLQAADIVQLIGQSVALKRRGKDFVGLCPFHQERTPSFHVSPTRQYFRCYGCKASGNAIDFVMKRDRLEFKDALLLLARQLGIELPKFGISKEKTGERQQLLDAHSAACGFFENLLSHPEMGRAAREYLDSRGFDSEAVRKFRLGLALESWDALVRSPAMKKYPPTLLASAGLVKAREKGDGFYDTFRNRLMFPIRDENGRIIAFGGRVMPGSEDPAKYLNSPETPLFSKSRCIFGLDMARQKIVETRTVAVVEGYTDVVMAHQFGATNVVSVLGTALTAPHIDILKRFADRIVLLFDADNAGDLAVNRAVELFLTQPIEIAIASMPQGMDPDEFLLQHGVDAFDKLLAGATDALSFKWSMLDRQFRAIDDLTGRQKALEQYLEVIAAARGSAAVDSLRWGQVLLRVSKLTGIPTDDLHRRFRPKRSRSAPPGQSAALVPARGEIGRIDAQKCAERWILGILLAEPHRWRDVQQVISVESFDTEPHRRLAEIYWNHQRDMGEPVFGELLSDLQDTALTELAVELVDEFEELEDREARLNSALEFFQETRRRWEAEKTLSEGRQRNGEQLSDAEEIEWLRKVTQHNQRPDLRRVGL